MPGMLLTSYQGRRVFVTGHTGFKGAWLTRILTMAGAQVLGYALEPPTSPNLYTLVGDVPHVQSVIADVRDHDKLCAEMNAFQPEIVIHMAAQPLVRYSYKDPVGTYETNVLGTVNVLDAVRNCETVRSVLNITTDKVYKNWEWEWGYRENDELNGGDPYSNSKSCSELVTCSYRRSFLTQAGVAVSTARAGNVIGGGDFSADRIIPDCVRAAISDKSLIIRNPRSTRPYQHVLDPLFAYLRICALQLNDKAIAGAYNIGPKDEGCTTTESLVKLFAKNWGDDFKWQIQSDDGPHEAQFLKLDCSKANAVLGWTPVWTIDRAVQKTVEWTRLWNAGEQVSAIMEKQIADFIRDAQGAR